MFIRKCDICGADFEAHNGNAKYCSEACRKEGKKAARQEWVIRTNYNEKKRHAMELYRAKITEEEYQKQRKKEKNRRAALKRKQTIERNRQEKELQDKAAAGDPSARMTLAQRSGNDLEYWAAYRDSCIEYDNQESHRLGEQTVNGISVYESNFPERVIEAIKRDKRTVTKFMYYHRTHLEES